MKILGFILSAFCAYLPAARSQETFKGKVVEAKTGNGLAFVNVGIVNGDAGTVTDVNGEFSLVPNAGIKDTDSLKFSMIGYKGRVFSVGQFRTTLKDGPFVVSLEEEATQLNAVVVSAKERKTKILGNKTESKKFSGGFGSKDLGSQIGIRIHVGKKDVFLDKFNFFVAYNTFDSLTFRVNIYKMEDGKPTENLLHDNVIIRLGKETGKQSVDLDKYNIVADNDFLIALEWLDKRGPANGIFNISASLLSSSTYICKTSQAGWSVKKGIGLGLNVTARE